MGWLVFGSALSRRVPNFAAPPPPPPPMSIVQVFEVIHIDLHPGALG